MKRKKEKKSRMKKERKKKKTESHCVKKWKHNFPFASAVPIFHKGIFFPPHFFTIQYIADSQ